MNRGVLQNVLFLVIALMLVMAEGKNDKEPKKGPKNKGPKVRAGSGLEIEEVGEDRKELKLRVDGQEVSGLKRRKFKQEPQEDVEGAVTLERDDCIETYSTDDAEYVVQMTNKKCKNKAFKNKKPTVDTPEESFSMEDEVDNGKGKKKGKAKKEDRGVFPPGAFGDDDNLGNARNRRSAVKSEALKLRNRFKRQSVPSVKYLEYSVIYDREVYNQVSRFLGTSNFDTIVNYWRAYHTSLFDLMECYMYPLQNTRILLRTGLLFLSDPIGCSSSTPMQICRSRWESYVRSQLGNANQYTDIWAFLTGYDLSGTLLGVADDLGSTCLTYGAYFGNYKPSSYMAELNVYRHIIFNTDLFLHETGHCLGIIHDNQGSTTPSFAHFTRNFNCGSGYTMYSSLTLSVPTPRWSYCSQVDYYAYLQYLLRLNRFCL